MRSIIFCLSFLFFFKTFSQELIIGSEYIEPGIEIIFEGAVKDVIIPINTNLNQDQTNVHIEARVNWGKKNIPKGAPKGGFIPYLRINSIITNQSNGLKTFIDLIPHLNLIDNFHYARNISLPGEIDDLYTVEFMVNGPSKYDLAYHKDWVEINENKFIEDIKFEYRDIDFKVIAKSSRK